jgi:hypothetical protein
MGPAVGCVGGSGSSGISVPSRSARATARPNNATWEPEEGPLTSVTAPNAAPVSATRNALNPTIPPLWVNSVRPSASRTCMPYP